MVNDNTGAVEMVVGQKQQKTKTKQKKIGRSRKIKKEECDHWTGDEISI